MRGTRWFIGVLKLRQGIIPALAGNTCCTDKRSKNVRDHPRACGEHLFLMRFSALYLGSSPRLRGTPAADREPHLQAGIIPALAGNTKRIHGAGIHGRDHPRACGEHVMGAAAGLHKVGSSPRLRGTHTTHEMNESVRGIIPALAGNTRYCLPPYAVWGDHPRACGEHSSPTMIIRTVSGSSPRLRGTLIELIVIWHVFGIIPALAGNTYGNIMRTFCIWDHPRACGEHLFLMRFSALYLGSSPRLRGTQTMPEKNNAENGIIPALAGNTSLKSIQCSSYRDHPRACGEHNSQVFQPITCPGSSPRLRGTLGGYCYG